MRLCPGILTGLSLSAMIGSTPHSACCSTVTALVKTKRFKNNFMMKKKIKKCAAKVGRGAYYKYVAAQACQRKNYGVIGLERSVTDQALETTIKLGLMQWFFIS